MEKSPFPQRLVGGHFAISAAEVRMVGKHHATKRCLKSAVAVYAAVWLVCFFLYWASLLTGALDGGMVMGYTALVLYCALPVAGAASAFLVGRMNVLGWRRLFAPFAIALLYLAFIAATFGLSTMLGLASIASTDFSSFVYGFAPAVLGLALGWLLFSRQAEGF